jgi:hypothetical protein
MLDTSHTLDNQMCSGRLSYETPTMAQVEYYSNQPTELCVQEGFNDVD